MGCSASNQKELVLGNGIYKGKYRALPLGILLLEGNIKYDSGETFNGNFVENMYNGYGKIENNLFTLRGEFTNNILNGKGIYESKNLKYHGEFKNSMFNGIGKILFHNYEYFGEICNNKISGYGKLKYENKVIFEGKWLSNKPISGKIFFKNNQYSVNFISKEGINNIPKNIIVKVKLFLIPNIDIYYKTPILNTQCNLCKIRNKELKKCSHLSVCKDCASFYKKCPICLQKLI